MLCYLFSLLFLNENYLKSKSAVGGKNYFGLNSVKLLGKSTTVALDKQMFSISQNNACSEYMLTIKSFDVSGLNEIMTISFTKQSPDIDVDLK